MRARAFVASAAIAGAACAWLACADDSRSHVFSARAFDPTRHCLEDLQSIDVVEGPEPETPCAPVCIVGDATDAGGSVLYVSTMCPPYPIYPYEADAGGDERCAAALYAYRYDTSCEADGAIVNLPPDAGVDADADANADADAHANADADADADASSG